MAIKSFSLRIDDKLLDKLHVVADYEGRSANSQVLYLIRRCVEQYENQHGKILEEDVQASKDSKK
ncbi:MAG: Arc family DNA-binding protein [Clostridia bacterium]|nr:Arc family DNA-binding protein [Clostridia bacterium]